MTTKEQLISPELALPGRNEPLSIHNKHFINGNSLTGPHPKEAKSIDFGMGCFWGAERRFWQQSGVFSTAVGYAGGYTKNPTYQEVCSGQTGHAEVVRVVYLPTECQLEALLQLFWESHDPTQGFRQGNDRGSQYRSCIYTQTDEQLKIAQHSLQFYQNLLLAKGYGQITTEIAQNRPFYFAEDYHQQYLGKNPSGYCGLKGTGTAYQ